MLRIAVIGSGLSGVILARRLATFAQVTVFERGGPGWKPASAAWNGHPVGMAATFASGLGGTTNLWHGGLMRISEREFGGHWPEAVRGDLENHLEEAIKQLHGEAGLALFRRLEGVELGDEVWGDVLVKPSPPFRARLAFPIADVELRANCPVTAVEPKGAGVEVVYAHGGLSHRRVFDAAVIAAGTFGSAELLLRSGLGGPCAGLHLHDHPMGFIAKLRPDAAGAAHIRATRARLPGRSELAYKVADVETGLVSAFYLRPAAPGPLRSDPYKDASQVFAPGRRLRLTRALPRLADPDFRRIAASRTFGHEPQPKIHYVLAFTEQEPMGQGRVSLGPDGRIEAAWTISQRAVGALGRNLHRFAAAFGAEPILPQEPLAGRLWSGAHHSGTCRLSLDPASGVVAPDLSVHGESRIFVCDGSVTPSSGATNTGLTIASLAVRLSKHLQQGLAGGRVRGAPTVAA